MDPIEALLDSVKLARMQTHLSLTLIPLLAPDVGEPYYRTLEEGISRGEVEITEVSEGGSVPELKLINRSVDKILVVDGEELVGAKQNRIVNATFLVAGLSELVIPVSCVEHGRWAYRTDRFDSGKTVMHASLRRGHQREVAASLAAGEAFRSDQSMIWDQLAQKAERMSVHSPTGAMADLFEGQRDRLSEFIKAFQLVECQMGAVFAINGEVVGLECFGHQKIFSQFFEKLIKSYALDVLEGLQDDQGGAVRAESVMIFLEAVKGSTRDRHPSVGLGEDVRLRSHSVSGAALVEGGRVIHLSAFKGQEDERGAQSTSMERFSQRRRRRLG